MLFDWNAVAAPGQVQDVQPCAPLTLTGDGLWVCLVSSGRCTASVPSAGPLPAGAALLLPPQSVPAGHLVLSRAPLVLEPEGSCHLLCVQLTGQASAQFLAGLHELPFLARGETCPAAAELLDRLASEQDLPGRVRSQLAFALLCELADADSAAPALPPLVQAAIADIRANYAGLYGVEELSERLGVSKSHLVRTFTAALGIPPGRYLTRVRVEAAQRLLLHREYTLDVVASPPHNGGHWPVTLRSPGFRPKKLCASRNFIFKVAAWGAAAKTGSAAPSAAPMPGRPPIRRSCQRGRSSPASRPQWPPRRGRWR